MLSRDSIIIAWLCLIMYRMECVLQNMDLLLISGYDCVTKIFCELISRMYSMHCILFLHVYHVLARSPHYFNAGYSHSFKNLSICHWQQVTWCITWSSPPCWYAGKDETWIPGCVFCACPQPACRICRPSWSCGTASSVRREARCSSPRPVKRVWNYTCTKVALFA